MFTRIGRFVIKEEIGRGGTAVVYLAHDPELDRFVAVKLLSKRWMEDKTFRLRFEQEKRLLAKLEHRAIVHLNEAGEIEDQPYLVMQWMPGGDLSKKLRSGPIPLKKAARFLQRISAGLDFAHQNDIVHRDIKPSNILFDNEGNAYLSDFGIAKLLQLNASLSPTTKSGIVMGTLHYISPEQLQEGQPVDGRSDIYSLGILFFETLTGKLPYQGQSPWDWLQAHSNAPLPSLRQYNPQLPDGLDEILAKTTAKNPAARFQKASEFAEAIDALQVHETTGHYGAKKGEAKSEPTHHREPGEESSFLIGLSASQGARLIMEDRSSCFYLPSVNLTIAIVADGIGGGPHGELAADLTIGTVTNEIKRLAVRYDQQIPTLLGKAVEKANTAVFQSAQTHQQNAGMGSTVVIAAIQDNKLYIANVGDSRVYLVRGKEIFQLTQDHNWANYMIQQGQLSKNAAWTNPNAFMLVRSVGDTKMVQVDSGIYLQGGADKPQTRKNQSILLHVNDRVIVCSNGLTKPLRHNPRQVCITEQEICQAVNRYEPQTAADYLVKTAVERKADDNISLIILEFPGTPHQNRWLTWLNKLRRK